MVLGTYWMTITKPSWKHLFYTKHHWQLWWSLWLLLCDFCQYCLSTKVSQYLSISLNSQSMQEAWFENIAKPHCFNCAVNKMSFDGLRLTVASFVATVLTMLGLNAIWGSSKTESQTTNTSCYLSPMCHPNVFRNTICQVVLLFIESRITKHEFFADITSHGMFYKLYVCGVAGISIWAPYTVCDNKRLGIE